jgi:RimJ/RimL family protein N-acetyltransferase
MTAPTINTERLTLRAYRAEDLTESAAMWADPLVVKHIGGKPFTTQQSWSKLVFQVGHWALRGFGYWIVEERSTGRFVGEAGFADFQRGIPALAGRPEGGWVLASWAHGRGFATEAVRAAMAWVAANVRSEEVVCMIDVDNVLSLRVAEKLGFRERERTEYLGTPVILLAATCDAARGS